MRPCSPRNVANTPRRRQRHIQLELDSVGVRLLLRLEFTILRATAPPQREKSRYAICAFLLYLELKILEFVLDVADLGLLLELDELAHAIDHDLHQLHLTRADALLVAEIHPPSNRCSVLATSATALHLELVPAEGAFRALLGLSAQ